MWVSISLTNMFDVYFRGPITRTVGVEYHNWHEMPKPSQWFKKLVGSSSVIIIQVKVRRIVILD